MFKFCETEVQMHSLWVSHQGSFPAAEGGHPRMQDGCVYIRLVRVRGCWRSSVQLVGHRVSHFDFCPFPQKMLENDSSNFCDSTTSLWRSKYALYYRLTLKSGPSILVCSVTQSVPICVQIVFISYSKWTAAFLKCWRLKTGPCSCGASSLVPACLSSHAPLR